MLNVGVIQVTMLVATVAAFIKRSKFVQRKGLEHQRVWYFIRTAPSSVRVDVNNAAAATRCRSRFDSSSSFRLSVTCCFVFLLCLI